MLRIEIKSLKYIFSYNFMWFLRVFYIEVFFVVILLFVFYMLWKWCLVGLNDLYKVI